MREEIPVPHEKCSAIAHVYREWAKWHGAVDPAQLFDCHTHILYREMTIAAIEQ